MTPEEALKQIEQIIVDASNERTAAAAIVADVPLLMTAIGTRQEVVASCEYWVETATLTMCSRTPNCPGPHRRVQRWVTGWQEIPQ